MPGGSARPRRFARSPAGWCATSPAPRSAASPACPKARSCSPRRCGPADAALLDPSRLAGVATEEGGADGHTAIMLRALGIPAVLGVPGLAAAMRPGDVATVDGAAGLGRAEPLAGDARLGAARGHRLRPRARPAVAAPPPARADARPRRGRAAGQSGAAGRAAADRAVRRRRDRPAAERVPVHEPRAGAGRGGAGRGLSQRGRGDGRRSGHHPRARLGRREGDRGAGIRRASCRRWRTPIRR